MKLLVDTSILIDNLRGGKQLEIFLNSINEDDILYISSIVIFELYSGLSSKKAVVFKKIFEFKKYFKIVDLDWDIARRGGEMNRDLNVELDSPDYLIAATAQEIGALVVTLNKKHFEKIPGLQIYPL